MSDSDPPPAHPVGPRPRDSQIAAAAPGHFCVAGIGASSGGLDACKKLLAALPAKTNIAFILVLHLDPTHASMMVELLSSVTAMPVVQATDGMVIAPDHLYIIPPGSYLAASHGALHLSVPLARHGARLPFDFLLQSIAKSYGPRAICVILSGNGADGSAGLLAIEAAGGLVIALDPEEAAYPGMPESAIATSAVDFVLPTEGIAEALINYDKQVRATPAQDDLARIILMLRDHTAHDFTLYKPGSLERRIARRMSMAGIGTTEMGRYITLLESNQKERDHLAEDLLINVTSFFRDPKIFETLAEDVLPELAAAVAADRPIRVWIAGCSTGEETYSLTILFREAMDKIRSNAKLQIFASDVDPQAVATAREGLYPASIEESVSPARLERFFVKEDRGYRVSAELRGAVVFTVQDVLADPPFSKLDMVSCRNLLIYLRPEAQAKIISIFNFALRQGGILLLGSAETVGPTDGRFAVISKPARIYRKIAHSAPADFRFQTSETERARVLARLTAGRPLSRHLALAELCKRMMLERFAPACVLVNHKFECLFSSGPTERYLRVAPGYPTHDLLAMTRPGTRARLKSAILEALDTDTHVTVPGGRILNDGPFMSFTFDIQPIVHENEQLLLICFIDSADETARRRPRGVPQDADHLTDIERELEATRAELQQAIRSLEISGEEQNAINEEALSVNEEYQSTNEELLTSKEELQSVNEELTALNGQLQETLERQRTTSNDLQNVLYSTDVATLFLDTSLKVRFFTPATTSLFTLIPGDIGRPLTDLHSRAADLTLAEDAAGVMATLTPAEREIETEAGTWFNRRILPYRTDNNGVAGVVITFTDITQRKQTAKALVAATHEAEHANMAKSRFLAAASHDLRQPLQTLTLLKGLLGKIIEDEPARKLLDRLDETMGAMSGMLNTLLDINQIDAGIVHPEITEFPINNVLFRLRDEFTYHAEAQGLKLRVVPCGMNVKSDPHLLEQMIRNLVSNAMKYTKAGRVLLGCRRRAGVLRIEIWDTGIGIPDQELRAIFEEYHQIDNAARERSRGLGLGLSIVQRLGDLLGHRIQVRSTAGKGSVFTIEVAASPGLPLSDAPVEASPPKLPAIQHGGSILIIEDDPDIRELLAMFLREEGYHTVAASGGTEAFEMVAAGISKPDLILADYNLPDGLNGLQVTSRLRVRLQRHVPVIMLTGDISTDTLRNIAAENCSQLNKPMKLDELTEAIQALLPPSAVPAKPAMAAAPNGATDNGPIIYIVDDDTKVRQSIRSVLERNDRHVESFASCEAFLEAYQPGRQACLLVDAYLPGMSGIELLQQLSDTGLLPPAIMITGHSDVKIAVRAMKAGATDFIEKPLGGDELLAAVNRALERSSDSAKQIAWRDEAATHLASLTPRQRQIMDMVLAGNPSKNIALDLGISQRTVENHRAAIMAKTGAKSLPALARLALAAG
jgi:two-component system CheB/CheR fusion protein